MFTSENVDNFICFLLFMVFLNNKIAVMQNLQIYIFFSTIPRLTKRGQTIKNRNI